MQGLWQLWCTGAGTGLIEDALHCCLAASSSHLIVISSACSAQSYFIIIINRPTKARAAPRLSLPLFALPLPLCSAWAATGSKLPFRNVPPSAADDGDEDEMIGTLTFACLPPSTRVPSDSSVSRIAGRPGQDRNGTILPLR
jgi:hypothetical protein